MRTFLPEDLSIKNWAQIETYFEDLNTRAINSVENFQKQLDKAKSNPSDIAYLSEVASK